jgi:hypothetical protein
MPRNPFLLCDDDKKFVYKPPYNIKGKNSLLKELKKHDVEVKGGILMSDLASCMLNADKVVTVGGFGKNF